jgi:zinc transport system substrate-binding protein
VVGDIDGVRLENLSEPQTGCLHDFQLTPEDMKLLSTADVFIVNGGGIESFMEEVAEAYPDLIVLEACKNTTLLKDEDGENAHAWMSVIGYEMQVQTIAAGLGEVDTEHREDYEQNAAEYIEKLIPLVERQQAVAQKVVGQPVILFHEAYAYVARDYGLTVSLTLDLDEERQVSAGEVAEVLSAIREDGVSVILAEELYGKSMAQTVQQEADVTVIYLDPLNRGDYDKDSYLEGMTRNIELLEQAFGVQEGE